MTLRDRPEFRLGQAGEQIVADYLKRRGWHYVPSYDFAGSDRDKAPRLQGMWTRYAVPDFDVSKMGQRLWVEVKTKSKIAVWRKTGESRHGIEMRLLEQYRQVERITGTTVWLFIYEVPSCWLLGQSLAGLGRPETGTDRGRPMAYWPRASFRELERIAPGTTA